MLRTATALAALVLLTFAPAAAAQDETPEQDTPDGVEVPGTGAPTEQGSVEEGPALGYGVAVLIGTLAFAGAFAYAAWRYARRPSK